MKCRAKCGACCIIPSISSPIPGMPEGKPAGVRCIHLDENYACKLFHSPDRPEVCKKFEAEEIVCGTNRDEAIANLTQLENTPSQELL